MAGTKDSMRPTDTHCPACKGVVEDENHFVCDCPVYRELREVATREVRSVCAARSHVMPSWWQAVVNPDLVLLGDVLKQVRAITLRFVHASWKRRARASALY